MALVSERQQITFLRLQYELLYLYFKLFVATVLEQNLCLSSECSVITFDNEFERETGAIFFQACRNTTAELAPAYSI
jgi:hypothetical protein